MRNDGAEYDLRSIHELVSGITAVVQRQKRVSSRCTDRKEEGKKIMDALIKGNKNSYDRYEELLLCRDAVIKEGFQLEMEYSRVFGELIIAVFQEQLKCVEKKKAIEFCQAAVNHGRDIDHEKLQQFIYESTENLRDHIEDMTRDYERARDAVRIMEKEEREIKKLYRQMVKLIHPDINPMVQESEELKDLWNRIVMAYNCNDLKTLRELYVLTVRVINRLNDGKQIEIDIPDIEDKIAELEKEIQELMENVPYLYKYLLMDEKAVEEKKKNLSQELESYQEYGRQLDEILDRLLAGGVKIIWKMN